MSDITDAIEALTLGRVTVGDSSNKMPTSLFSILESGTSDMAARMNPGFKGMELAFFKARLILDLYVNSGGSGSVFEKTVKDTRWKTTEAKSSSFWMDQALQQIDQFNKNVSQKRAPSGVCRCDFDVKGFDNSSIVQYGDPSDVV